MSNDPKNAFDYTYENIIKLAVTAPEDIRGAVLAVCLAIRDKLRTGTVEGDAPGSCPTCHRPAFTTLIDLPCPKCKKKMVLRRNRVNRQEFLGCPGYPDCDGALSIERAIKKITSQDTIAKANKDNRVGEQLRRIEL